MRLELSPATPRFRILYLTVLHPDDPGEEFFDAEIEAIRHSAETVVVPVRPWSRDAVAGAWVEPLLGWQVVRAALRCAAQHPIRTALGILDAIDLRRPGKTLRNLLCVPKAMWLATRVGHHDTLFAGWLSTPATVAMIASRISGRPWASSAHRRDIVEAGAIAKKVQSAGFIRAISKSAEAQVRCRVPDGGRVVVVHLGIATAPVNRSVSHGRTRILCVAGLIELKNHATLLRALAMDETGEMTLTMAGDGPLRAALEQASYEYGVAERVDFAGHIPHADLMTRLSAGEWAIVTLASTTEGIPVCLMEALVRGIPVVASRAGGTEELVAPAGGLLVDDPFNARAFLRGWQQLLDSWTTADAHRAHALVQREFAALSCGHQIIDMLRRLG